MIDLHSHILPGIDDGAQTLEESLEILKNATECGVTDIVATPHFILGSEYNANNKLKRELLSELKNYIKKEKIKIKVHLGNEVFIDNEVLSLIRKGQITTINRSKYILFELPISNKYKGLDDFIFKLKSKGYIPILAHPERYLEFKNDPNRLFNLVEKGVLLQCNIGSFFNRYNKDAKKLAMLLLKRKYISFIGSDTHTKQNNFYEKLPELKKILSRYMSKEEIEDVLENNARKVLKNEKIESKHHNPFKKTLLGKWR